MRHLRSVEFGLGKLRLDPGSQRCKAERAFDFGSDRPGAVALGKCDLVECGAAQATARGEERDRFDQIGLARAVRPDEHSELRIDGKRCRAIAADICEIELANACRGHEVPAALRRGGEMVP